MGYVASSSSQGSMQLEKRGKGQEEQGRVVHKDQQEMEEAYGTKHLVQETEAEEG